jgi:hypothetical protein
VHQQHAAASPAEVGSGVSAACCKKGETTCYVVLQLHATCSVLQHVIVALKWQDSSGKLSGKCTTGARPQGPCIRQRWCQTSKVGLVAQSGLQRMHMIHHVGVVPQAALLLCYTQQPAAELALLSARRRQVALGARQIGLHPAARRAPQLRTPQPRNLVPVNQDLPRGRQLGLHVRDGPEEVGAERAPVIRLLHVAASVVTADDVQVELLEGGVPVEAHRKGFLHLVAPSLISQSKRIHTAGCRMAQHIAMASTTRRGAPNAEGCNGPR